MGTENDFDDFIQLQKQKLAKERELLTVQQKENIAESQPAQRKQWSGPQSLDNTTNSNIMNLGHYESKRKQLDEERKREYNEMISTKAGNSRVGNRGADDENNAGLFSKLGEYESKRKVLDVERKNEYNHLLTEVAKRGGNRERSVHDATLPGLRDHASAEQSKVKQRNAEYNAFLQSQQSKQQNRFAAQKQYIGQPPANQTPRSETGGHNPSYEELLEQKRQEEQRYRRQNDPIVTQQRDQVFHEQDSRYDQRKVKFANDRNYESVRDDVYEWPIASDGRSKSFHRDQAEPRVFDIVQEAQNRSKSVPPREEQGQGGLFFSGGRDDRSALRRKKEAYRHDLEQQISSDKQSRARDRQGEINHLGFPTGYQPSANNLSKTTPRQAFVESPRSILDDRRPLASILNERRDLIDTSAQQSHIPQYQSGLLERGFAGLYEPGVLSRVPASGTGPPLGVPPLDIYSNNSANQSYQYYATRDPLYPQNNQYQPPPNQNPQQSYYPPPQMQSNPTPQQYTVPPTQQLTQQNSVAAVGSLAFGTGSDPGKARTDKMTYQNDLRRQMEEKERQKVARKAEQEAYDQKLQREIDNYNPFGRGGGGAPMKDSSGNVVADLRTLNSQNTGKTPRTTVETTPRISDVPTQPSVSAAPEPLNLNNSGGAQGLARGGHGVFGEPANDAQKNSIDKYKEELRQQIEEKKRKAEEEKRKILEEEEREIKRLEEERVKMQKEFEAEQAKQKAKQEETKRKNEEMKIAAEEKRVAVEREREERERKQKEEEDKKRKQETERSAASPPPQTSRAQRVESPPIPTLRSKTQPPGTSFDNRADSPPLPAQRAKTQAPPSPTNEPVAEARPADPAQVRVASGKINSRTQSRSDSRSQSAEVLNQLANMRKQLQNERQRVENALEQQKVNVYDPRTDPQHDLDLDVFEIARSKKPVSALRRQKTDQIRNDSPVKSATATSLLQSDSAFIDNNGLRGGFPDDFEAMASNQNARRKRRERMRPAQTEKEDEFTSLMRQYLSTPDSPEQMLTHYQRRNVPSVSDNQRKVSFEDDARQSDQSRAESVVSVDPDRINRKNQDRLRKLKAIAGDDISVADPDDIIDRFMNKQSHNRPVSGQTLNDETWIHAGGA